MRLALLQHLLGRHPRFLEGMAPREHDVEHLVRVRVRVRVRARARARARARVRAKAE